MKNVNEILVAPGAVVTYKDAYYLLWKINDSGKAQLLNPEGKKFTGTPDVSRLTWIKSLPVLKYVNTFCIVDKHNRIFSLVSGNEIYKANSKAFYQRNIILGLVTKSPIFLIQQEFNLGKINQVEMMDQMMDQLVLKQKTVTVKVLDETYERELELEQAD